MSQYGLALVEITDKGASVACWEEPSIQYSVSIDMVNSYGLTSVTDSVYRGLGISVKKLLPKFFGT